MVRRFLIFFDINLLAMLIYASGSSTDGIDLQRPRSLNFFIRDVTFAEAVVFVGGEEQDSQSLLVNVQPSERLKINLKKSTIVIQLPSPQIHRRSRWTVARHSEFLRQSQTQPEYDDDFVQNLQLLYASIWPCVVETVMEIL